jgi:hypothetical protein
LHTQLELPHTEHLLYSAWPQTKGVEMKFRLIYEGQLPAASRSDNRTPEKHAIRRALHPQLRNIWNLHQATKTQPVDTIANNFAKHGFRWVPLVPKNTGLACALDILFLRRDMPGQEIPLVKKGGDIDNRLKVFLDALRMPDDLQELGGALPGEDEDPFFCLLQDDYFITEINITTDRLLTPPKSASSDVVIVTNVRLEIVDIELADYYYLGN